MQIKDKRAVVTGAARGLGLVFSRELLRNGAAVVVMVDILDSDGQAACDNLNFEFGKNRAFFVHCDVTKGVEFEATFKEIVKTYGGLDILINNAGIFDEDDISRTVDVNVTAVIRGTMMGIQQMGKDCGGKGGVVVNVASVSGLKALPNAPIYSSTKHAVISFSRSFAQPYHYQRTAVKIIVLCPGMTNTPMFHEKLSQASTIDAFDDRKSCVPQKAENVAHGLVYTIRCAKNGSIWISENNEPVYEIQLPDVLPAKDGENENEQVDKK